jgi:hypothetical protein
MKRKEQIKVNIQFIAVIISALYFCQFIINITE